MTLRPRPVKDRGYWPGPLQLSPQIGNAMKGPVEGPSDKSALAVGPGADRPRGPGSGEALGGKRALHAVIRLHPGAEPGNTLQTRQVHLGAVGPADHHIEIGVRK